MEKYKYKNMQVKSCEFTFHSHFNAVYLPLRFSNCQVEVNWKDPKIRTFFHVFDLEGGSEERIQFSDVGGKYCVAIFNEEDVLVGIQHLTKDKFRFMFDKTKDAI